MDQKKEREKEVGYTQMTDFFTGVETRVPESTYHIHFVFSLKLEHDGLSGKALQRRRGTRQVSKHQ